MSVARRIHIIFSGKNNYNLSNYKMEHFSTTEIMLHFVNLVARLSQYGLIFVNVVELSAVAYPRLAHSTTLKSAALK